MPDHEPALASLAIVNPNAVACRIDAYLGANPEPECNTPGVSHMLSNGFELKHDMLSGNQEL